MSVRLIMTLDANLDDLVGEATRLGFKRMNPRRAWTDIERREAARYAVNILVNRHLETRKALLSLEVPK